MKHKIKIGRAQIKIMDYFPPQSAVRAGPKIRAGGLPPAEMCALELVLNCRFSETLSGSHSGRGTCAAPCTANSIFPDPPAFSHHNPSGWHVHQHSAALDFRARVLWPGSTSLSGGSQLTTAPASPGATSGETNVQQQPVSQAPPVAPPHSCAGGDSLQPRLS